MYDITGAVFYMFLQCRYLFHSEPQILLHSITLIHEIFLGTFNNLTLKKSKAVLIIEREQQF